MIDFSLTEEQRGFQKMARDFGTKEIEPIAAELDRIEDPEKCFPWDAIKKGNELGFNKVLIPKEYGGLGGTDLDLAVIVEELGAADIGLVDAWGAHFLALRSLIDYGTEEQKQKWLRPVCEDNTHTYLAALAATEHGTVGDSKPRDYMSGKATGIEEVDPMSFVSAHTLPASEQYETQTTARLDGDTYVLNGMKRFITNGGVAQAYCVVAKVNLDVPDVLGIGLLMVPADAPGVSIGKIEDKLGHRLSQQAEIIFEDVQVPTEDLIKRDGTIGAPTLGAALGTTNAMVGAGCVGLARAAYEAALEYAKVRYKSGGKIVFHQAVGLKLADMAIKINNARNLVWQACWHMDNFGRDAAYLSSMAKVYCSDIAMEVTTEAIQVFGGYGYMRDFPVEKYFRDAKLAQIYDGTNEVLRLGYILPYLCA